MPTNGETIRAIYDAIARGDAGGALGAFDAQIVWNEAEGFPCADRNPYLGPQQVAEGVFGRLMSEWDGFVATPDVLLEAGDSVVAQGRYRGTFQGTGRRVDAPFAHVWTLQDGRVTRFQQYTDTAQFARAIDVGSVPAGAPAFAPGMSAPPRTTGMASPA